MCGEKYYLEGQPLAILDVLVQRGKEDQKICDSLTFGQEEWQQKQ
jgi:hypothetical protein